MSKQSYERDFFGSFSLVIAACGSFMSRCFYKPVYKTIALNSNLSEMSFSLELCGGYL